ncbi:hypothetical protein Q8A73_004183 [Channa argus]|nr:hypothetical protein Q8A73_004183 [Channa argus]
MRGQCCLCASARQELTRKGCGDASMRKRRAQATSLKHGERESGNQNMGGQVEQSRGGGSRAALETSAPRRRRKCANAHCPDDDHITLGMNGVFVGLVVRGTPPPPALIWAHPWVPEGEGMQHQLHPLSLGCPQPVESTWPQK